MLEAREAHHSVIYRDEYAYCAHAHAAVAADGTWLVVFNYAPRRSFVLHPPEDPLFRNMLLRSADRGASWSAPQIVPSYERAGTECAGLTVLSDGMVMLNQWCFDWYPLGLARQLPDQSRLSYPANFMRGWLASPEHDVARLADRSPEDLAPWARAGGKTFVHLSKDQGASFTTTVAIDTAPYSGGYGMRSAAELADGTLVLLLSDIPNYRQVFAIRSENGGMSWSRPDLVAAGSDHEFEEPAIIRCRSGKLLAVLRDNATRFLHQVESADGGLTWTAPRQLDIGGYPAHLLTLDDGRVLMTYGWRKPDFGIRAVISPDEGRTWQMAETIRIRGGMPNKNLGYPATIPAGDGAYFTVYYGEDEAGCTCIMATRWRLP
ncbi:MAG: sialidase family protein [Hyphomicrobiales bacterium]